MIKILCRFLHNMVVFWNFLDENAEGKYNDNVLLYYKCREN